MGAKKRQIPHRLSQLGGEKRQILARLSQLGGEKRQIPHRLSQLGGEKRQIPHRLSQLGDEKTPNCNRLTYFGAASATTFLNSYSLHPVSLAMQAKKSETFKRSFTLSFSANCLIIFLHTIRCGKRPRGRFCSKCGHRSSLFAPGSCWLAGLG